jgi:hypothetical protein
LHHGGQRRVPDLDDHVEVVGHDHPGQESVFCPVVVPQAFLDHRGDFGKSEVTSAVPPIEKFLVPSAISTQ